MAIFRNDYKPPPKNLWIEKNTSTTNQESNSVFPISGFVDDLEDRMVGNFQKTFTTSYPNTSDKPY